jgi:hypothetical protein
MSYEYCTLQFASIVALECCFASQWQSQRLLWLSKSHADAAESGENELVFVTDYTSATAVAACAVCSVRLIDIYLLLCSEPSFLTGRP